MLFCGDELTGQKHITTFYLLQQA